MATNRRCLDTHYYTSMYHLPPSKKSLVTAPIQSKLCVGDKKFKYLPILSRYQITTKSYCNICFGLLNINKNNKDQYTINQDTNNYALHLESPHNYPCPNKGIIFFILALIIIKSGYFFICLYRM